MNRAQKKTIHDELDLRGEPMAAPPEGLAEAIRREIPEHLNLARELGPERRDAAERAPAVSGSSRSDTSHSRTVLSSEPEASTLPSGDQASL